VTEFFEVINTSATHIYTSALALTPISSIVRKLYSRYVPQSPRVVIGLPTSWDPRIANVMLSNQYPDAAWSPCGRFVAVSTSTGVEIRDSTTLEKLSALESPMSLSLSAVTITYSPNGRLLACACTRPFSFEMAIAIWDIQTGGIVKAIHGGEPGYPRSMLYSSDGKMLSVACGKTPYKCTVYTFDTTSGERGCSGELGSEFDPVFWMEKDSIRFASSNRDCDDLYIETWEITSTANGHPTKIDSLHVRHEFDSDNHQVFFSPASLRVAIVSVNSTVIRDARNSNILLEASASRTLGSYAGHFSSDGNLFVCTEKQEVHIWKATSEGYIPWARFPVRFSTTAGGAFVLSPDSGSIVGWGLGIMEVWKVDHLINPKPSGQPSDFWGSHLVAFSTNGTHVAIGRASSSIVTVVNLHSGASELVSEVDLGIVDIKMVDNTVFALRGMEVVSWVTDSGSCEEEYSEEGRSEEDHSEEERGIRRAGADQSLNVVKMLHDWDLDPRLLDDQCRNAISTWANIMVLFDADTGARLVYYDAPFRFRDFRFSPDGRQLWVSYVYTKDDVYEGDVSCLADGEAPEEGLEIVEDEETEEFTFVPLPGDARPPDYPWKSSEGYKIDGVAIQWVLDRDERRLLWLPPHWRTTNEKTWRWNGDFLVLRKGMLPEPVIIQLSSASEPISP